MRLTDFLRRPVVSECVNTETLEQERTRRERELVYALHGIDNELADITAAARTFRKENFAMVGGNVVMMAADMTSRAALETQWKDLSVRTYRLQEKRNAVLKEWSDLKVLREKMQGVAS